MPRGVKIVVATVVIGCTEVHLLPERFGDTTSPEGGGGSAGGTETLSASSSTGEPPTICEQFCEATGDCFEDCHAVCETYQSYPCEAGVQDFLNCIIADYDAVGCTTVHFCGHPPCLPDEPIECGPEVCGGSESQCSCRRPCTHGELVATCHLLGELAYCDCSHNGLAWMNNIPTVEPLPEVCSLITGPCAYYGY